MPRSARLYSLLTGVVVAVAACSDVTSPVAAHAPTPTAARLSKGGNTASLVPPGATLNIGDTLRLVPELVGKNGSVRNIKSVTYAVTAGPANAVSIDSTGLVTALAPGMVSIEATINGHYTAASTIEVLWPATP